jgi:hypothetical protein
MGHERHFWRIWSLSALLEASLCCLPASLTTFTLVRGR